MLTLRNENNVQHGYPSPCFFDVDFPLRFSVISHLPFLNLQTTYGRLDSGKHWIGNNELAPRTLSVFAMAFGVPVY